MSSFAQRMARRVYRILWQPKVKSMVEGLGLRSGVQWLWDTILKLISDDRTMLSVDEVSAEFRTVSKSEIRPFYPEFGEREVMEELLRGICTDDVFYDIGAHVGSYACIVGRKSNQIEVHAFEPHPDSMRAINHNANLNGVNVNGHLCFLSDENDIVKISKGGEAGTRTGLLGLTQESGVDVPVRRGDEYIFENGMRKPTVMKIDVDGAEMQVLRGLEDTLDQCRLILCEVHPQLLREYEAEQTDVHQYLELKGFQLTEYGDRNARYYVIAERKTTT